MIQKVENILHRAQLINEKHIKLEETRGDRFNIFYILGLQSNENRTHSAFLTELLNPKGDHLKGNLFLKLFLNYLKITDFDPDFVTVVSEKYIGKRNLIDATGGRVDIFIENHKSKRTICIENKIYAGDQEKQIERYCNFNTGQNTVLYLTLDGRAPENLTGGLSEGKDFSCISYSESIKDWLELCIKETYDSPILRETIRQYIVLINRLSGHISNGEMEQQLNNLILDNIDSAALIVRNFESAVNKFRNEFRDEVALRIQKGLSSNYRLTKGLDVNKVNSQLWIEPAHLDNSPIKYGIETFSGRGYFETKGIIYGLFSPTLKTFPLSESLKKFDSEGHWLQYSVVRDSQGNAITLNRPEYIKLLYSNGIFREETIQTIVTEFLIYFNETNEEVLNISKGDQSV
ncbi:hypothetical protein J2T02_003615 [Chitinophaga terrae (ex Kim and Jung 2007)]|nr:hypothetical protein [Chitinophaga terrae (ex Kim and Jung 2007)]